MVSARHLHTPPLHATKLLGDELAAAGCARHTGMPDYVLHCCPCSDRLLTWLIHRSPFRMVEEDLVRRFPQGRAVGVLVKSFEAAARPEQAVHSPIPESSSNHQSASSLPEWAVAGMDMLKQYGVTAKELRIVGGGSRNQLWRRIIADSFQLPLRFPTEPESAALGAALQAAAVQAGIPVAEFVQSHEPPLADEVRPLRLPPACACLPLPCPGLWCFRHSCPSCHCAFLATSMVLRSTNVLVS